MLSIGMAITLTCLLNAYFAGVRLITPYGSYDDKRVSTTISVFNGLMALVGIYIAVKFVIWVVKKLKKLVKTLKEKLTKHSKSSICEIC